MTTRAKVKSVLVSLAFLPNSPDLTRAGSADELVDQYFEVLGHWSDEVLNSAVLYYRSTGTFFPTAGNLNEKILELALLATGVPTPGEAWSQVLGAVKFVETVLCENGETLRTSVDGKTGGGYWSAIFEYRKHKENCEVCVDGGYREIYNHTVVKEVVDLLGGRERVVEGDNSAANRKQFIDAYTARVKIEGQKLVMPPKVLEHIQKQQLVQSDIKMLSEGMKK